jgi:hypothetical protein
MSIVLPNDALAAQLPQSRIVITTRRNKIRAIGAERAVPNPTLVPVQRRLERKRSGVALRGGRQVVAGLQVVRRRRVEGPDARGVVGAAGCEVADVGGEKDARDVGGVGGEFADGDDGGGVVALDHAPDVDVALDMCQQTSPRRGYGGRTALLPAQTMLPSDATVTDATLTSSSGISWWLHLFSPRSQMRTLPPRSQLMSSPWFGWMTTSLTGTPWV